MVDSVHKEYVNVSNTPGTTQGRRSVFGGAGGTNSNLHGTGSSILATHLMSTDPLETLEQAAIHDFRKCSWKQEMLEV